MAALPVPAPCLVSVGLTKGLCQTCLPICTYDNGLA